MSSKAPVSHALGADAGRSEHVKRLGEHGGCGENGLADFLQAAAAPFVLLVARVEEGDQRPCIDQNHFRSFLRSAAVTPRRVSVEGALAYPPGPRSSRA